MIKNDSLLYTEKVSSNRTHALFIGLTICFGLLFFSCLNVGSSNFLRSASFVLFLIFLFYSLNYRVLKIQITKGDLRLSFGIIRWTIPVGNIASSALDELPFVMKYGGAGVHFMTIRRRYRTSFNFLEYPRVVIALKQKVGPVRDISFSTRHPQQLISLIQQVKSAH